MEKGDNLLSIDFYIVDLVLLKRISAYLYSDVILIYEYANKSVFMGTFSYSYPFKYYGLREEF